jgi:exosome complex component RRP41
MEQGNTKVLAAVYGPRQVSRQSEVLHDRAIVKCEYSMATFSTGERKHSGKGDRRSKEISLLVRQTFESVILTELHARSQIDIFLTVLQADGGERCAAINAATLALIDAGIPMRDFVCACSAGYLENTALLDLNNLEESGGGAELALAVTPADGKIVMLQMDQKLPLDRLPAVLDIAKHGAKAIHALLVDVVRQTHSDN